MASSQTRSNNGGNKSSSCAGVGANDDQIIERSAAPESSVCRGLRLDRDFETHNSFLALL
ncbi:predicted protein [Arabidopsis lyrata subsp. lyrata]|uniref:Predicted protein n=1 Tax=Arabidopsis lyrata subsp. lyrata TaxID=81972 RepID=D7LPG0_ARALL|nr:predicted protein [Arabidopsis lyrata subsp. lyrata]